MSIFSLKCYTIIYTTSHIGRLEIYFNRKMILTLCLWYFTMCYPGQLIRATRVTLLCSRCWMCLFNMPCTPYQNTVKGTILGIIPVTIGPISLRDTFTRSCLPCLPHTSSWAILSPAFISFLLSVAHYRHSTTNPMGFFSSLFLFLSPPIIAFYSKSECSYCVCQDNHKISHFWQCVLDT